MTLVSSTAYKTWIKRLRMSWMGGPTAQAIFGGFAQVLGDRTIDWAKTALREHLPLFASAEANALTASERQIEPGLSETAESLAERLCYAVPQHRLAGTPFGLLLQLHFGAELPWDGTYCVQQNGLQHGLGAEPVLNQIAADVIALRDGAWMQVIDTGPNPEIGGNMPLAAGTVPWWTFDASGLDANNNQYTARFAVLITTPPAAWTDIQETPTSLTAPPLDEVNRLRRFIKKWRPAKAKCMGIFVNVGDSPQWGVNMEWGSFTWGGGGGVVFWGPDET